MVAALGTVVLTGKVALVAPAGIFTLAGTKTAPAGSAASETATPSAGAAMLSVTVPCSVRPSVTLAELRLIEDNNTAGSWAETDATTPKDTSKSERRTVPSTRIRLIDLVTSGPFASM